MTVRFSLYIIVLLIGVSSCQKKKQADHAQKNDDRYVPSVSSDTVQSYLSPSDTLSDRSRFNENHFRADQIDYRGKRKYSYIISRSSDHPLTVVVEYLHGAGSDTASTAVRLLIYADELLLYRKAFPPVFSEGNRFGAVTLCDHIVLNFDRTKSIVYYWLSRSGSATSADKEFHAVAVDPEGISSELSGTLTLLGSAAASGRFVSESQLAVPSPPHTRYRDLKIIHDVSIDWKECSAFIVNPSDTIYNVSLQSPRMFPAGQKLFAAPHRNASVRTAGRRTPLQGVIRKAFVPSMFVDDAGRDMLYVEFQNNTAGWIDAEAMMKEEILRPR